MSTIDTLISSTAVPQSVYSVVLTFTATVSKHDRNATYTEFRLSRSKCRIVVSTTSLGMGINIPDVERVVVWKVPITKRLADAWQRIGRGGRRPGSSSNSYVFLPYWMFDKLASYRPGAGRVEKAKFDSQPKVHRRGRNQLPIRGVHTSSQLSQYATPGDTSDVEDGLCDADTADTPADELPASGRSRYWNKAEMASRDGVPNAWLKMVNGECHCRGFLAQLGEYKLPMVEQVVVDRERCCSKCNPSLLPTLVEPPQLPKPPGPPRAGTLASYMVVAVEECAMKQAALTFGDREARFPIPPGVCMERACRWEMGSYCSRLLDFAAVPTFDSIREHVPLLQSWDPQSDDTASLMRALPAIVKEGHQRYADNRAEKQSRRELRKVSISAVAEAQQDEPAASVDSTSINRGRDLVLAQQVAAYAAARGSAGHAAQRQRLCNAVIASPGTVIDMPSMLPDGIRRGVEQLQRIRYQAQLP